MKATKKNLKLANSLLKEHNPIIEKGALNEIKVRLPFSYDRIKTIENLLLPNYKLELDYSTLYDYNVSSYTYILYKI